MVKQGDDSVYDFQEAIPISGDPNQDPNQRQNQYQGHSSQVSQPMPKVGGRPTPHFYGLEGFFTLL